MHQKVGRNIPLSSRKSQIINSKLVSSFNLRIYMTISGSVSIFKPYVRLVQISFCTFATTLPPIE
jgi:hypothetical protein